MRSQTISASCLWFATTEQKIVNRLVKTGYREILMMCYRCWVLRDCYKAHNYGELVMCLSHTEQKAYYKNKNQEWIKQTGMELDA